MRKFLDKFIMVVMFLAVMFFAGFSTYRLAAGLDAIINFTANWQRLIVGLAVLYVFVFAALGLQIVFHELGHMAFGFLTGYKLLYFRIGSYTLANTEAGMQKRVFTIPGTGGQCLMIPKKRSDGSYPFVLYHLGGIIANIILSAIAYIIFRNVGNQITQAFLIILISVGIYLAIMNIFPFQAMVNDGRNIINLLKSAETRDRLYESMYMEKEEINGREYKVDYSDLTDLTKIFNQEAYINQAGDLIFERKFDQAAENLQRLLQVDGLNIIFKNFTKNFLEVIYLIKNDEENLKTIDHDKAYKNYLKSKNMPMVYLVNYLRAKHDGDPKAHNFRENIENMRGKYLFPPSLEKIIDLMNYADDLGGDYV